MIPGVNQEQFLGLIRALVTFVGGILVARGSADIATVETISGIAITLSGMVWSFAAKRGQPAPPTEPKQ